MLRRIALSLAVAFSLAVAPSCTSLAQFNPAAPISAAAPEVMNKAKVALTAAHNIHKSTAVFLTIAAETNLCTGTCASQAKTYLVMSHEYLLAADSAVALGDVAGIEDKVKSAISLVSQINALVGKK